ncbi:OLC1v1003460C1 [Oldenlandia corymbosa var. corymbosa]|uniref:OLC1v1003460C1 n=1 Tax=Oldenlandia corymbosa var. corymbosa TaxID=529605 RepID=A0AAV1DCG6_OLDCO|nr:OLC1v1003460C1 [Oldenlandia corymbosa var. corymbosa]
METTTIASNASDLYANGELCFPFIPVPSPFSSLFLASFLSSKLNGSSARPNVFPYHSPPPPLHLHHHPLLRGSVNEVQDSEQMPPDNMARNTYQRRQDSAYPNRLRSQARQIRNAICALLMVGTPLGAHGLLHRPVFREILLPHRRLRLRQGGMRRKRCYPTRHPGRVHLKR